MSQSEYLEKYHQRQVTDYVYDVARSFYAVGFATYLYGMWIDWQTPGKIVIEQFVVANQPHPNSGVFILAILFVAVGYAISKLLDIYESLNEEPETIGHETEWSVEDAFD